jgi:peptide/nickel transport system substrate-binding protein
MYGRSDQARHRLSRLGAVSYRVVGVLMLIALTFAFAACGSKSKATITVLSAGDVDYLDPGLAYYQFSYEVLYPIDRPLISYKADSTAYQPDMAASMPTVSDGGQTITVHLRKGVKFAPPVNREVTSADIKYAIERGFSQSVPNGYTAVYFNTLVGAPTTLPVTPKGLDIPGIQTPDKYTVVFKLSKPSGVFVGALALPLTAPVPEEYASKYDDKKQSDYGFHQVATGPYMIKNDKSGNVSGVGYIAEQRIELVRNPNWDKKTDFRPAYADKVVFKEGFEDPTVMTKEILAGTGDVNGDSPIPASELKSITSNASQKKQLTFTPVSGSRYIPLNTSKPPFDNIHVRKAVAYVLDRNAMRLTRGGAIDGKIATHFIDPGFENQGFTQAGGFSFAPFKTAGYKGDVAKAMAEMKLAGYPSGKYTGGQITMVADNAPPGSDTAQVVANSLSKIGFKVKINSVKHSTMYTQFCMVVKEEPNICPNAGWQADFLEPQTLLDATFNGNSIIPANNSNFSQLNDPTINAAMEKAKVIINPTERYKAWGEIDKMITNTAAAIPWLWEDWPTLFSTNVSPARQLFNGGSPDVAFMKVKK